MDDSLTGPVWAAIARTGIVIQRTVDGWTYETGIGMIDSGFVTAEAALEYALIQLRLIAVWALQLERTAAR